MRCHLHSIVDFRCEHKDAQLVLIRPEPPSGWVSVLKYYHSSSRFQIQRNQRTVQEAQPGSIFSIGAFTLRYTFHIIWAAFMKECIASAHFKLHASWQLRLSIALVEAPISSHPLPSVAPKRLQAHHNPRALHPLIQ
ncbi:hypothetical protein CEXT_753141 [Caerostris extrusa]|uniref:Uncharacterized protein n=1 Tax=Caerostris extrusa TaxID=172846 RepID=A0AAV4VB25_CAEEX|nr:hypothetical protein CEXT_753141 [Caerostris extrusa]